MNKKQIAAVSKAVAKHVNDVSKEEDKDDETDTLVMSLQTKATTKEVEDKQNERPKLNESTNVNTSSLKSILHHAKNSN